MEKVSKRVNAIQEVKESVGLLTQLLGDYSKESAQSNEELIKVRHSGTTMLTHTHTHTVREIKTYLSHKHYIW